MDPLNCAKFLSLKCSHFSLWLNPTGHSKFRNTSNHPLPATDSCRTASTPLYPPVQAAPPPPPYSLPPFLFLSQQRNQQRPVPVPMTGVCYNSLLWMCTLNTVTWPDLGSHLGTGIKLSNKMFKIIYTLSILLMFGLIFYNLIKCSPSHTWTK